jgi:hypothetical protein
MANYKRKCRAQQILCCLLVLVAFNNFWCIDCCAQAVVTVKNASKKNKTKQSLRGTRSKKSKLSKQDSVRLCLGFRGNWFKLNIKNDLDIALDTISTNDSADIYNKIYAVQIENEYKTNGNKVLINPYTDFDMMHVLNVPADTMDVLKQYPMFAKWYRGKKPCSNFYSTSFLRSGVFGIAYALFKAPNLDDIGGQNGQLNRAFQKIGNSTLQLYWDWSSGNRTLPSNSTENLGKDVTPPQCNGKLATFPLNSFCVDPQNAQRIFVALGGNNTRQPGKNRVLLSEDAGDNWIDYSDGLTVGAVNCIVYDSSAESTVYIGCGDGVYFRKSSMNKWCKMDYAKDGKQISNINITELKIESSGKKLIAILPDRSIWISDLVPSD